VSERWIKREGEILRESACAQAAKKKPAREDLEKGF
jgi:hypothetical protein